MKISDTTIKQLDQLYSYLLTDEYSSDLDKYPEKANRIVIGFEKLNGNYTGNYIGKSISTPKNKEVTIDWILTKLNNDSVYVNFSNQFKKLIGHKGIDIYPTSYGIGVFVLFGEHKKSVKTITDKLQELNIDYSNEYSDAAWVYRFKISKSQENIKKIKSLVH